VAACCALQGHKQYVRALAWSRDGEYLVSGSWDGGKAKGPSVKIWNLKDGTNAVDVATGDEMVHAVALSPDGKLLATGGREKILRIWDFPGAKLRFAIDAHPRDINAVAFSPDSKVVASCGYSSATKLWDAESGKPLAVIPNPPGQAHWNDVAFSPDGKYLAMSGAGLRVIEVAGGKELFNVRSDAVQTTSLCWSPDGKIIATGGMDSVIKFWDAATGKQLGAAAGHTKPIQVVRFSPDGRWLASGAQNDPTIRLWPVVKTDVAQPKPEVAKTPTVTTLSNPLQDVAVAGGGQFLVCRLPGQKGLYVYDTSKREGKTLALPSAEFAFGAGGDTVVVALPKEKELHSYSVSTFKKTHGVAFQQADMVMAVVMGHSKGDLALVRLATGREALDPTQYHLLDTKSLQLLDTPATLRECQDGGGSFRDVIHHRANGNFTTISRWATGRSPQGVGLFVRDGNTWNFQYNHDTAGYLAMGDDGRLYSGSGAIFVAGAPAKNKIDPLRLVVRINNESLFPALGGKYFLGLNGDGQFKLYQAGTDKYLSTLGAFADWKNPRGYGIAPVTIDDFRSPFTLDKHVLFVPERGVLVLLPLSNSRIVQLPFELQEVTKSVRVKSSPPLRVKGGGEWKYQLVCEADHPPLTYKLARGPEGMSLSPAGQLTWRAPSGIQGVAVIMVTIMDAKGQVVNHEFTVTID
jgi:WD40 repeat protein